MEKHLKLQGRLSADFKFVTVTVMEATHLGAAFGDPYSNKLPTNVFQYDKVRIRMKDRIPSQGWVNPRVYHITFTNDPIGKQVTIPSSIWPSVKATVEEYNRRFSGIKE